MLEPSLVRTCWTPRWRPAAILPSCLWRTGGIRRSFAAEPAGNGQFRTHPRRGRARVCGPERHLRLYQRYQPGGADRLRTAGGQRREGAGAGACRLRGADPFARAGRASREAAALPHRYAPQGGCLRAANAAAREAGAEIVQVVCTYRDSEQDVLIANSEGRFVTDRRVYTRLGCQAVAGNGTENPVRL